VAPTILSLHTRYALVLLFFVSVGRKYIWLMCVTGPVRVDWMKMMQDHGAEPMAGTTGARTCTPLWRLQLPPLHVRILAL
jgi:hypothetical protein